MKNSGLRNAAVGLVAAMTLFAGSKAEASVITPDKVLNTYALNIASAPVSGSAYLANSFKLINDSFLDLFDRPMDARKEEKLNQEILNYILNSDSEMKIYPETSGILNTKEYSGEPTVEQLELLPETHGILNEKTFDAPVDRTSPEKNLFDLLDGKDEVDYSTDGVLSEKTSVYSLDKAIADTGSADENAYAEELESVEYLSIEEADIDYNFFAYMIGETVKYKATDIDFEVLDSTNDNSAFGKYISNHLNIQDINYIIKVDGTKCTVLVYEKDELRVPTAVNVINL